LCSEVFKLTIEPQIRATTCFFFFACQQACADGIENVDILPVLDDVWPDRRLQLSIDALAGNIGAASEAGWSFDAVLKLGTRAIASIACTLDHCHILKRSEHSIIPPKKQWKLT